MVVLTSFVQPKDGIRHQQRNTTVYVNDNNLGKGTLYIAESCLSWVSDSGNGFSLEYPHICLHAISRDLSAFPQECLFLMLDTNLGEDEDNEEIESGDNENGSTDEGTTELRLVPDDKGMLDAMFHAMNTCQAFHPDPEESLSDEDLYEDADDEIPIDETDSRMANLRLEHRDCYIGGIRMGREEGQAVGILGTNRGEERVVGTLGLNRGVGGILDRDGDRVVGGILSRAAESGVDTSNRGEGMVVGTLEADIEDMVEDTMEDSEDWEDDTGQGDRSFPRDNM